jgi:hypothetical protein
MEGLVLQPRISVVAGPLYRSAFGHCHPHLRISRRIISVCNEAEV